MSKITLSDAIAKKTIIDECDGTEKVVLSYTTADGNNGMASVPVSYFNTGSSGGGSTNMTYLTDYIKYVSVINKLGELQIREDIPLSENYIDIQIASYFNINFGYGNTYYYTYNGDILHLLQTFKSMHDRGKLILMYNDNIKRNIFDVRTPYRILDYNDYVKNKATIDNIKLGIIFYMNDYYTTTYTYYNEYNNTYTYSESLSCAYAYLAVSTLDKCWSNNDGKPVYIEELYCFYNPDGKSDDGNIMVCSMLPDVNSLTTYAFQSLINPTQAIFN